MDERGFIDAAIRHLASFERASASAGERRAAEWIAARFDEEGLQTRLEVERAHGGYWWPLGLLNAVGLAGAALAGRGRSPLGRALAAAACLGLWDDLDHRDRRVRRVLPRRDTANVVGEAGDPAAPRTVLLVAHHDAAHGGAIFDTTAMAFVHRRFPELYERFDRWPPLMWLVVLGPLLVALGARRAGALVSAGTIAAMTDIGARSVVPGANDNLSSVAVLLALARRWRTGGAPAGVRVILLSTGSEESNSEGMHGFVERHADELARGDVAAVIALECLGSGTLTVAESEGFLAPRTFDVGLKELASRCAERLGIEAVRGLHVVFTSDGSRAMRVGLPTMLLGAIDELKLPANYHKPTDVADNVDLDCVVQAVDLVEAIVRELGAQPSEPASARAAATAS